MCRSSGDVGLKFYIEELREGNRWVLHDVKFNEVAGKNCARDRCAETGRRTRLLQLRCLMEFKEEVSG